MPEPQFHLPVLAEGRAVVGIDIGKNKHAAVAIDLQGKKIASRAVFSNNRQEVGLLQRSVFEPAGPPNRTLFAMEATGHYWMPLYHELVRRGYQGVVLNPIQTHGDARTRILRQDLQTFPKKGPFPPKCPGRRSQTLGARRLENAGGQQEIHKTTAEEKVMLKTGNLEPAFSSLDCP